MTFRSSSQHSNLGLGDEVSFLSFSVIELAPFAFLFFVFDISPAAEAEAYKNYGANKEILPVAGNADQQKPVAERRHKKHTDYCSDSCDSCYPCFHEAGKLLLSRHS